MANASTKRFVGLDVLRGIAVLMVICHHLPVDASAHQGSMFHVIGEALRRGGWVGVDLFFVLSGFLISGLLFAEHKRNGSIAVSRFYLRRGGKIYPPFIALIVVTVLVQMSMGRPIDMGALLAEVTFMQAYLPGMWNHTWSLSVEEHFYLVLPLLLLLCIRIRGGVTPFAGWIPGFAIGIGFVALALRLENYVRMPWYHHHTHLAPTHLRIDSLFFGVLIGYWYQYHGDAFARFFSPHRHVLVIVGSTLCALPFLFSREEHAWIYVIGPTLFYLGSGALVVVCILSPMRDRGLVAPLSFIGAYSYSIYLWHMPMIRWGTRSLESGLGIETSGVTRWIIQIGGSIVLGVIMAKAIEVPALRLRDRWVPSQARPSTAPTVPQPYAVPSVVEAATVRELGHS